MGKYRTQQLFVCPYCNIAGWFRRGQRDKHVSKSHAGKAPVYGTGIKERFLLENSNSNSLIKGVLNTNGKQGETRN
jgi:hypothetical protein